MRNQRGFMEVEILVAIMVIMVPLLALMELIPLAAYSVREGNQRTQATYLASRQVELTAATPWSDTESGPALGATTDIPQEGFTRSTQVDSCATAGVDCGGIADANARKIVVSVAYTLQGGIGPQEQKSVTLAGMASKR